MAGSPVGRNASGLRGVSQLMVRIGRGAAARSVSVPLPADAQLAWSAPGGDDTFTCTVPWPDRGIARPDAFTHNMPVRVEDRRTGEIVWQGRIADPGLSGNRAGQEFRLSCVGAGHDLDMVAVIKNYVDRDPDSWTDLGLWSSGALQRGDGAGFVGNSFDSLNIDPNYYLEFPSPAGSTMQSGIAQGMSYLRGFYASQDMDTADASSVTTGPTGRAPEVHGVLWSWMTPALSGNDMRILAGAPEGSTIIATVAYTAAGVQNDHIVREGYATWTRRDYTYITLEQTRSAGTVTSTSDGYIRFSNLAVVGKRYDRYGRDWTGDAGRVTTLSPYEIFEDMLGTVLNGRFDPGQITADSSTLIDHAAWWDPTSVTEVLDAANAWNADAWWGVWAPANPDGLPRLDYRSWNVTPRYTLDDTAQVQLAGGGEAWANSALIAFKRGADVTSVTRATVSVPALTRIFGTTGAGTKAVKTRDLAVDLTGRGPMSRNQAAQLATALVTASAAEKESGSATVQGPILDDATGRLVQPWEIRPGWPILVGSTPGQFASGAPLVLDGESTFRLTKVTYSAGDDSAALEFDGGVRRLVKGPPNVPRFHYVQPRYRKKHR